MKRILINATQAEELRVAMVNGQLLYDLDIEIPSREQKKSNIYKGVITRVEPSLEAAFVNYGAERHGFLPFKEISRNYFAEDAKSEGGRYNIKDAVKEGQEIIIQVEKEERGNKGAALTSFISLAGRFLVAMPQNPRAGGVSRRIEGEEREQIRKVMSELEIPKGMGVIARTAGVGRSTEEMQWDLDYLTQLWTAVEQAASEKPAPFLIYQESDIVIRALRDHYKSDIGEIIIDSPKAFDRAHEFMSMVMPNALHKLKKFDDSLPLFNRYQIENQIESAFAREVTLSSGGAIVIDHTEALISIDINSARATKGSNIEDTALNTNLEAADEIARQLRVRDLGGLVVIDFIDMLKNKNQREVEQRLRNAVYEDRARVQIGRISRFGLLEMSRQRLRPSIGESSQIICPRCSGQGSIRDIESLSLSVLRLLEEDALKENTGRIVARLPVECATYLLNEKRSKIAGIETRNKVHCVIVPDPNLETPHFHIERVRDNETQRHESSYKSSYEMASEETTNYVPESKASTAVATQTAAVQRITPPAPKPQSTPVVEKKTNQGGLLSKVMHVLFGSSEEVAEEKQTDKKPNNQSRRQGNQNRNRSNQGRSRNNTRNNSRNNQKKSQGAGQNQKNPQRKAQPANQKNKQSDDRKNTARVENKDKASTQEKNDGQKRNQQARKPRNRNANRRNSGNRPPKPEQVKADVDGNKITSKVNEGDKAAVEGNKINATEEKKAPRAVKSNPARSARPEPQKSEKKEVSDLSSKKSVENKTANNKTPDIGKPTTSAEKFVKTEKPESVTPAKTASDTPVIDTSTEEKSEKPARKKSVRRKTPVKKSASGDSIDKVSDQPAHSNQPEGRTMATETMVKEDKSEKTVKPVSAPRKTSVKKPVTIESSDPAVKSPQHKLQNIAEKIAGTEVNLAQPVKPKAERPSSEAVKPVINQAATATPKPKDDKKASEPQSTD